MKNTVIIVAGGSGTRMGTTIPKQFLEINGKPVILHTLEKFISFDPEIEVIMLINPDHMSVWNRLILDYNLSINLKIAIGGETRFNSVKNGLALIKSESLVGIHDAVRPLIKIETISNIYKQAGIYGNAVPSVPVKESVREIKGSGSKIIDRSVLQLIQTPQVFLFSILKKAYNTPYLPFFTDDASVVEKSGVEIHLVRGDYYNIKITSPEDIEIARNLLD